MLSLHFSIRRGNRPRERCRIAAALTHSSHLILCYFVKAVLLLAYNSSDFEERFFFSFLLT